MVSSSSCPIQSGAENYTQRGTSWHPMLYTGFAATTITTIVSLSLVVQHLRRYRSPDEQRQIVRIVLSVIVYSFVAFFEIVSYSIAEYIDPIGDVYESFGLCALFLLYMQYASPSGVFSEETFQAVKASEEIETNYNWPKIAWIFVFQYPVVEILCVIIQEISEAAGVYCLESLSPKYAHLWLEIIESVGIGLCVLAILGFRGRMKRLMKVRRGFSKLIAFKIIVFIRFAQQWAFSSLLEYNVIKPSSQFSYNDIFYGIPAVLTCCEMVLFAVGFWYAFSASEYSSRAKPMHTRTPIWKAVLDVLNPSDLIMGTIRIFKLFAETRRDGDWREYRIDARTRSVPAIFRKGVAKYKARKGGNGRYQEIGEGTESLTMPMELHRSSSPIEQRTGETGY